MPFVCDCRAYFCLVFELRSCSLLCFLCKGLIGSTVFTQLLTLATRQRSSQAAPLPTNVAPLGLYNLGKTCFLNCILQVSFLNNPCLQRFFLSSGHASHEFSLKNEAKVLDLWTNISTLTEEIQSECIACLFDLLFQSYAINSASLRPSSSSSSPKQPAIITSPMAVPISPTSLLCSLWNLTATCSSSISADIYDVHPGPDLTGYLQQDAHEAYICLLSRLHSALSVRNNFVKNDPCSCIIHDVFGGKLASTISCPACGYSSTTYDSFLDLSLAISIPSLGPLSLIKSIEHFLSPEHIDDSCPNYSLGKCSGSPKLGSGGLLKSFKLTKLPQTLCLHLKRFEHSKDSARKIDTLINFPLQIDMRSFIDEPMAKIYYEYSLLGVILHSGSINSGHYTSFVRVGETWFKADDSSITQVSVESIHSSNPYILFYIQRAHDTSG
ncbi:cysteine proteinase [Mitosporidium daphniae]|uniref:Cysteine proteinase n=1 Tax=Mitosporidium daphniae TaxID=1485682 RepID=A0A098VRL1_9MICR|nr:cysteine proteinase [Mitosporidium daphniae]KGG51429.1 cysteine proteinase [Mitosporidium daphniae]|eukprot:XP_013237856.1 cysteine proteinase [Mitosporidium daphniae]